jgi:hypothetical protein
VIGTKSKEPAAARRASLPVSTVHVHVHRLSQIFNSLDPSPFWDRDLDSHAAQFIEGEFSDRPRARHWVLEVSADEGGELGTKDVQRAVKTYYERMVTSTRKQIREKLWIGQWALLVGGAVFLACMLLRQQLAQWFVSDPPHLIDEGLIVLAWVAIWIPVEQLFYDLAPQLRRRRFYRKLMQVRVHVRHALATPHAIAPPVATHE